VDIVGTPKPFTLPNLEPEAETQARSKAELLVPKGVKNLARNKPVTSSDKSPIVGELSMVTDGDKDAAEGYEVELAPGKQWVQIDLGKQGEIYAIAVWHYHRQKRAYKSVAIQLSDDPKFEKGVTTVFNNDIANDLGFGAGKDKTYTELNVGRVIPIAGAKARYVRLWSINNTSGPGNHYIEVEVYGK